MNNTKDRQFKVLLYAMLAFAMSAAPVYSERPVYYGISPAYPKSAEIPPSELRFPFIIGQRTIPFTLEIDQSGTIKKALPQLTVDSFLVKYVLSSLVKLQFEPAVINGAKAASNLPILIILNPRFRSTTIEFPVDAATHVKSRSLYFKALESCGAVLPRITKFPSYFCDLSRADSLKQLPFALLCLDLDESGQVKSSEIVNTNLPAFSAQIQSAALWAVFDPLKLNNEASPCRCFLIVSFFPQLEYPTGEINSLKDTVFEWYDRWRVQLLPDTVGLMLPPLPRNNDISELNITGKEGFFLGEVVANLSIDTLGNVRVRSIDTKKPPMQKAIVSTLKNIKFYSAMNFSGDAVPFEGTAKFSFQSRTSVRVDYFWLAAD